MITTTHTRVELLARADLFLLLADLLRPPCGNTSDDPTVQELTDVFRAAGFGEDVEVLRSFTQAFADRRCTARHELEDEFHRLFEGAMICPPNETAFIRRDKGAIIGDLCGFYRAFGLSIDAHSGEKPDHIVTELEFVSALLTMAAEAGDDNQREMTLGALTEFCSAHLADWIGGFCKHLSETTHLPVFGRVAEALAGTWSSMTRSHAWTSPDNPPTAPTPAVEWEESFECGLNPDQSSQGPMSLTVGRRIPASR